MIYRFYIDNTEWNEEGNISGWNTLRRTIQRSYTGGDGITVVADGELLFTGQLYDKFHNDFINGSVCRDYNILIMQSKDSTMFTEFYRGKIFLSDCEFDLNKKECKVKVQDNSFYSRINNNKSINISVHTGKSKNGIAITPADVWNLTTFNCDNGIAHNTCEATRVYDLLRYMIDFMTDGEVGFHSDVFNVGGLYEGAFVTTGLSLRTGAYPDLPFELNWATVVEELYKNFNIAWDIINDPVQLKPIVRVERQTDMYPNDIIMQLDNPYSVGMRYRNESNYSRVQIGSNTVSEPQQSYLPFPEDNEFVSFKPEEYFLLGQCNIDNMLDLRRRWIVSSNVIFDTNYHLSQDYDEDIYLIMCTNLNDTLLTADCKKSNSLTGNPPPYYYNEDLYSSQCMLRFYGAIPNSIIKYLGNIDNTFLATLGGNQQHGFVAFPGVTTVEPYMFSNDSVAPGYDPGNNYNNALFRYIAPATGVYSFSVNISYSVVLMLQGLINFRMVIRRYNASNVLVQQINGTYIYHSNFSVPSQIFTGTTVIAGSMAMVITDYVVVALEYEMLQVGGANYLTILSDSTFACTVAPQFGGIYQEFDPNDFKAVIINFASPVTMDQAETILSNKTGKYAVMYNGTRYEGWIDRCVLYSGSDKNIAEISLITSLNNIN